MVVAGLGSTMGCRTLELRRLKRSKSTGEPYNISDLWTEQETYMAFLRIAINMSIWKSISIPDKKD